MIHLLPIAQTEINWEVFLKEANLAIGRNPLSGLDERWVKSNRSVGDFLSSLKEIESPGTDPFGPARGLLIHAHVSFILVCTISAMMAIVAKSRLNFTVVPCRVEGFQMAIVSGTLYEWRSALLDCCAQDDNIKIEVRRFGTAALNHMEQAKLAQFMSLYKTQVADGTVNLLERK